MPKLPGLKIITFNCPKCDNYMMANYNHETETYFGTCDECNASFEATKDDDGVKARIVERKIL